jgi:hypothetical protein
MDYESKIIESSRELSAKEKLAVKDVTGAKSLDEVAENERLRIHPQLYAVCAIHNENAKDKKDYKKYIIVDYDGFKYITGSESFWKSFIDIHTTMNGEDYEIDVFKKPSKNYSGKYFISCGIVL